MLSTTLTLPTQAIDGDHSVDGQLLRQLSETWGGGGGQSGGRAKPGQVLAENGGQPRPVASIGKENASKQILKRGSKISEVVSTLKAIGNTSYGDLNAKTWEVYRGASAQAGRGLLEAVEEEVKRRVEETVRAYPASAGSDSSGGGAPAARNWSQGNPFRANGLSLPATQRPDRARKMKQLLVRIDDEQERESLAGKDGSMIMKALKSTAHAQTERIVGVNRMRSGDLIVQVASEEAREGLERDTTWVANTLKTARVARKSFPVMIHAICVANFDVGNRVATKKKIEEDNRRLHPGLDVVSARWVSGTRPVGRWSSLVVDVASPAMADEMIKNRVVENSEMKRVERFDRTATAIQCFKCQIYRHMSKLCKNTARCAECRQSHNTWDHEKLAPNAPKACAVCGAAGHTAYAKHCPFKVKERQRTAQRVANKAPLYSYPKSTTTTTRLPPVVDGEGFTLT